MRLLSLLFIVLMLPATALSQQPRGGERESVEKAIKLLDEIAAEARSLRLADNRALVLAAAADLYWDYDPDRGRNLFKEAAEALAAGMSAVDPDRQPELTEVFEQLQEELINAASRRDIHFALELLRLSEQNSAQGTLGAQRLRLEEALAADLAAREPMRAESLADQSLARGKFEQLPRLIAALQANDPETAARVARKFLAKLRAQNPPGSDAKSVEAMFGLLGAVTAPTTGERAAVRRPSPLLDQRSVRELAEMAVAAASSSDDPALLLTLKPALPSIERVMPEAVPDLRLKLDDLTRTYGEPAEDDYLTESVRPRGAAEARARGRTDAGRVEELTELAARLAADGQKESARMALDEARELAGESVRDSAQLAALLDIAAIYAELEPEQSFRLIETIAGQLDFLAVATKAVGGFFTEHFERDDELLLRPLVESVSKISGDNLGRFSTLARQDFRRLKAATDRLQHPETRTLAHLLLARSVLEPRVVGSR